MKKIYSLILLLLLTAITFSLVSCSSDDEGSSSDDYASLLIGSWKRTDEYGWCKITFKSDGSYVQIHDDGDKISGTYQLSGSKIIRDIYGIYQAVTIISISKSTLVLEVGGYRRAFKRVSN